MYIADLSLRRVGAYGENFFPMADIQMGDRDPVKAISKAALPLAGCAGDRLGPDAKGMTGCGSWRHELVGLTRHVPGYPSHSVGRCSGAS